MKEIETKTLSPVLGLNIPIPKEEKVETVADHFPKSMEIVRFLRDTVAPVVRRMEFGEEAGKDLPSSQRMGRAFFAFSYFVYWEGRSRREGEDLTEWAQSCGSKACLGGWYSTLRRGRTVESDHAKWDELSSAVLYLSEATGMRQPDSICSGEHRFARKRGQRTPPTTEEEFEARIDYVDRLIKKAETTPYKGS